ncbi:MAG: hypothetical protein F4X82_01385 [Candidatus Spechtbacteria bacterium SB0662_bin_43]|uniref:Uncharacterized protein n=1 Tax=Candidatus Spechtbacteria bacterium SB0662_bin_43 TaxID=2604897 RepID=A0A845DAT4_9BACT|nr:hypothetical protein [Candidatus Spechtbacteria bacterium SB0662_bin_43]
MIQNIFHRKSRGSGDSGTFSAQKKARQMPVSSDLLFFVIGVIGLIVLYFVLQGWHSRSETELQTAVEKYDQAYADIQTDDFHQATFFVSKARALVDILDSSTSFIPVIERFTESVHQDVVLETIGIDIENDTVKVGIKAGAHDVFSLGQQYLVWRDKSPWIVDITLDSMTIDSETQIVDFTATIFADMSLLGGEQQPDTEPEPEN